MIHPRDFELCVCGEDFYRDFRDEMSTPEFDYPLWDELNPYQRNFWQALAAYVECNTVEPEKPSREQLLRQTLSSLEELLGILRTLIMALREYAHD